MKNLVINLIVCKGQIENTPFIKDNHHRVSIYPLRNDVVLHINEKIFKL